MGILDLARRTLQATQPQDPLENFITRLSSAVIERQPLVEQPHVDDEALETLRHVNDQLILLEQLAVETGAGMHAETLRAIVRAEGEEQLSLIRSVRDSSEREVLVMLRTLLEPDNEPEVRKAAASALLYNGDPEGVEAVRQCFIHDTNSLVRSSSIYALKPDVNAADRDFLIEQFPSFDARVRRAAVELLKSAADQPVVQDFLDGKA